MVAYNPAEPNLKLTRREKDVLKLRHQGKSRKEIAGELRIAYRTVETHFHNVYVKLKLDGTTDPDNVLTLILSQMAEKLGLTSNQGVTNPLPIEGDHSEETDPATELIDSPRPEKETQTEPSPDNLTQPITDGVSPVLTQDLIPVITPVPVPVLIPTPGPTPTPAGHGLVYTILIGAAAVIAAIGAGVAAVAAFVILCSIIVGAISLLALPLIAVLGAIFVGGGMLETGTSEPTGQSSENQVILIVIRIITTIFEERQ